MDCTVPGHDQDQQAETKTKTLTIFKPRGWILLRPRQRFCLVNQSQFPHQYFTTKAAALAEVTGLKYNGQYYRRNSNFNINTMEKGLQNLKG
jgi:hypothetical protein